jgi:hypothetical protein
MNNKTTNTLLGIAVAGMAALAAGAVMLFAGVNNLDKRAADLNQRLDQLTQREPRLPPLSPEAETLRTEYLARLEKSSAVGLRESDKCSAYYIALHQSERMKLREEFITSSRAAKHSEKEIDHVIALDENGDTPYALYVFMACGNGEKPLSYANFMRPKF